MIGKHLSHYLIESELGRGGMGIVYRARDTKLDRTVAIKVLPSAALASEDDRARFYREAKAAAALTHPHIAIIYGVDEAVPEDSPHGTEPSPFIAMEFIDGETLEEKIKGGPLPLDQAVKIAEEITSALKLAHEKDIVHRDIKAANVMLAGDGSAKVLDFGLAQTAQSTKLTRLGSTLGTAAYMSPEQARGELVDARSDLWSIGVTLFEMISGRPPFSVEYEQAALYSILNEEPDALTSLRTGVSFELERIVTKCLMKDRDRRYQHAADLIADLAGVDLSSPGTSRISTITGPNTASQSAEQTVVPQDRSDVTSSGNQNAQPRKYPLVLTATAVLMFALGAVVVFFTRPTQDRPVRKFELTIPDMGDMSISHAGDRYAYVMNDTIFVQDFSSVVPRFLTAAAASRVFWSPDDTEIGFTNGLEVARINSLGGQSRSLSVLPAGVAYGAAWLPSGEILVSLRTGTGQGQIVSVPLSGGAHEVFRQTDRENDISSFNSITSLPDGSGIAATVLRTTALTSVHVFFPGGDVSLLDTDDRSMYDLTIGPDGKLLYSNSDGLWSVQLSNDFRRRVEDPRLIAPPGVRALSSGFDGTLLYSKIDLVDVQARLVSTSGVEGGSFGKPGSRLVRPLFHPSEDRILLSGPDGWWMADSRGSETPVSTGYTGVEVAYHWFNDERHVAFASFRGGSANVHVLDLTTSTAYRLLSREESWAPHVSRQEDRIVFYGIMDETRRDLFYADLVVEPDTVYVQGEVKLFLSTDADEAVPRLHPDGDLLLYQTNSSGNWEVAVRTFPVGTQGYWPITINGGYLAKWDPTGKWIYFMTTDGKLWRVPFERISGVRRDDPPTVHIGEPEFVFDLPLANDPYTPPYDIGRVSQRIVVAIPVREPGPEKLVVVENWEAEEN